VPGRVDALGIAFLPFFLDRACLANHCFLYLRLGLHSRNIPLNRQEDDVPRRTKILTLVLLGALLVLGGRIFLFYNTIRETTFPDRPPAPEFPQQSVSAWLNGPPLLLAGLKGSVVLLFVWTHD
jgi:hypothetical protein